MWRQWLWAVCCSCCWLGFVGVSVVLTPAAATSAAGAALTHVAVPDTVSIEAHAEKSAGVLMLTLCFRKSD